MMTLNPELSSGAAAEQDWLVRLLGGGLGSQGLSGAGPAGAAGMGGGFPAGMALGTAGPAGAAGAGGLASGVGSAIGGGGTQGQGQYSGLADAVPSGGLTALGALGGPIGMGIGAAADVGLAAFTGNRKAKKKAKKEKEAKQLAAWQNMAQAGENRTAMEQEAIGRMFGIGR